MISTFIKRSVMARYMPDKLNSLVSSMPALPAECSRGLVEEPSVEYLLAVIAWDFDPSEPNWVQLLGAYDGVRRAWLAACDRHNSGTA